MQGESEGERGVRLVFHAWRFISGLDQEQIGGNVPATWQSAGTVTGSKTRFPQSGILWQVLFGRAVRGC